MIKPIYVSPSLRETSLFAFSQFLKISQEYYSNIKVGGGLEDLAEGEETNLFGDKGMN